MYTELIPRLSRSETWLSQNLTEEMTVAINLSQYPLPPFPNHTARLCLRQLTLCLFELLLLVLHGKVTTLGAKLF